VVQLVISLWIHHLCGSQIAYLTISSAPAPQTSNLCNFGSKITDTKMTWRHTFHHTIDSNRTKNEMYQDVCGVFCNYAPYNLLLIVEVN
jgi:hypothetical protein